LKDKRSRPALTKSMAYSVPFRSHLSDRKAGGWMAGSPAVLLTSWIPSALRLRWYVWA